MTANVLLQVAGVLVLASLTVEVFMTALTMRGAGPLTGGLARILWRGLLAVHRRRASDGLLGVAGGAIAALTLGIWITALWAGWSLVFAGAPGAVVANPSGLPADLASRIYFAGFNIFTLGLGDFRPEGPLWQVVTVLASASGLVAITVSITYLLPILSQAVSRQTLAGRINLIGATPNEVALNAASGGLDAFGRRLGDLVPDLLRQGRQHLAYPVLHYFHTSDPGLALRLRLAVLYEGVLLHNEGLAQRPPAESGCRAFLQAADLFLDSVASEVLTGAGLTPDAPPLAPMAEAGLEVRGQAEFEQALGDRQRHRRLLRGFVEHDGWAWSDIEGRSKGPDGAGPARRIPPGP